MTSSTATYQAVPTDVDLEADGFKPIEQEEQQPPTQRIVTAPLRPFKPAPRRAVKPEPKKAFFRILATVSILYAIFYGLTRSGMVRGGKGCIGDAHRNISTKLYTLPSGDKIPGAALGVWRADRSQVGDAVKTALRAGYRHIDGAWIYGNEAEVGAALKESRIPRDQVWLTSKLWNSFHAPEDIEPVLDDSLKKLGTEYLDLYLIHWPVAFKKDTDNEIDYDLTENPYPTWRKLEEMVEKGKVRNIGISNFNIRRIQNLTANPLKVQPAVNQVELNYWNPQPELLQWAKDNNLLLEAYSPLGSAEKVKETLEIPLVKKIASELDITPAQVYISWHLQRGTVVLPKSVTPSRIEENFKVVTLPQQSFDELERAATSHAAERAGDPSGRWGVDIFD